MVAPAARVPECPIGAPGPPLGWWDRLYHLGVVLDVMMVWFEGLAPGRFLTGLDGDHCRSLAWRLSGERRLLLLLLRFILYEATWTVLSGYVVGESTVSK